MEVSLVWAVHSGPQITGSFSEGRPGGLKSGHCQIQASVNVQTEKFWRPETEESILEATGIDSKDQRKYVERSRSSDRIHQSPFRQTLSLQKKA